MEVRRSYLDSQSLTRVLAGQHYVTSVNPLGHGNEKGLEELGVLNNVLLLDDIDERALREVSTGGSAPIDILPPTSVSSAGK